MARKTSELKKRCWLAKQRLKMGYWEAMRSSAPDEERAAEYAPQRNRYAAQQSLVGESVSPRDELLYKKVCEILGSSEVTVNPIGQLIERDVYDELDGAARQRYILELSQKFRELQERYYKEKTGA